MKLQAKHYGFVLGIILTIVFIYFLMQEIPDGCFNCFMDTGIMWVIISGIALLMILLGINIFVLSEVGK